MRGYPGRGRGILSGLPDIRVSQRPRPGRDHLQPGGIVPGQQQQGIVAVPATGQQQQRAIVGVPAAQPTATTSQRRCQDSNNKATSLYPPPGNSSNGPSWGCQQQS